jgi:hypothetical protein
LGAIAIAVAFRDVKTSTVVHFTWAIAYTAGVQRAHTFVHVITHAVLVEVLGASTTTHTERVKLVAVAVAVASRNI